MEIFTTAWAILQGVNVMIGHTKQPSYGKDNTPKVCAALYTHAIEEYGKLLYLMSLTPRNGFVDIDYNDKYLKHRFKFNLALSKLPKECTRLHEGEFSDEFSDEFNIDTRTEWETRLTLLNTDIDAHGDPVNHPIIDLPTLQKAVAAFEIELVGTKY